jgi:hypothetical protein
MHQWSTAGLTGTYGLNVCFAPAHRKKEVDPEPCPTFEQALQLELGLKLEKGKGPVEVLAIDRMQSRPKTDNLPTGATAVRIMECDADPSPRLPRHPAPSNRANSGVSPGTI